MTSRQPPATSPKTAQPVTANHQACNRKRSNPWPQATIEQLSVELEAVHYTSLAAGEPVSSIDFDKMPSDRANIEHLCSEAKKELTVSFSRCLEGIFLQQKTGIAQVESQGLGFRV